MTGNTPRTGSSSLLQHFITAYSYLTGPGVLQALQLIFAVIVAGPYGVNLAHYTKSHVQAHA